MGGAGVNTIPSTVRKRDLAHALGISVPRLHAILKQPGAQWSTIEQIAAYLGVPAESLAERQTVNYGDTKDYGKWRTENASISTPTH